MNNKSCNIAIIGAGVVGSALARELASRFSDITLIEKEPSAGLHTSGRNSGVLHSGIHPRPGTLKARLCVEGNQDLRRYCMDHGIPMEEHGTLVVATEASQVPILEELKRRGDMNGVPDVRLLFGPDIRRCEPHARGLAGLFSPTGAIVDSKALTQSLAREAQQRGVTILFNQEVQGMDETTHGVRLTLKSDVLDAQLVINGAGLHADRLAHGMGVGKDYTVAPFRGEYFVIDRPGPPLVQSMIYPTPDLDFPFLGVHLTKTVTNQILVGPNAVPAFGREAYRSSDIRPTDLWEMVRHRGFWNALRKNRKLIHLAWNELRNSYNKMHFFEQASRLVEGLSVNDLVRESRVGIRPQLIRSDGELVEDLVIETTPRSIHILNVVSPGMTSATAFARWFSAQLRDAYPWQFPNHPKSGINEAEHS